MDKRRLVQFLALGFFILTMVIGKQQIWFLIFLIGIIGAIWWGRFYCGWLCPINTGIEMVDKIYTQYKIKRLTIPKWVKSKWVKYMALGLFLATIIMMVSTGRKIPVLLILMGLGIVLSLFYSPALWHRYLCPYGTILTLTGKFARQHYFVQKETCIKCNKCRKVCPAEAVIVENKKDFPIIDKSLCLICGECKRVCDKDSIVYGKAI